MKQLETVRWLDQRALLLLHEESLAEHGGLRGLREAGLFESAMMRPQQLFHYKSDATLAELAAAYAFGLARNHPFADGNKRAAYLALDTFCRLNGWVIQASQVQVFETMMSLGAGETTEEELAEWIHRHLVADEPAS